MSDNGNVRPALLNDFLSGNLELDPIKKDEYQSLHTLRISSSPMPQQGCNPTANHQLYQMPEQPSQTQDPQTRQPSVAERRGVSLVSSIYQPMSPIFPDQRRWTPNNDAELSNPGPTVSETETAALPRQSHNTRIDDRVNQLGLPFTRKNSSDHRREGGSMNFGLHHPSAQYLGWYNAAAPERQSVEQFLEAEHADDEDPFEVETTAVTPQDLATPLVPDASSREPNGFRSKVNDSVLQPVLTTVLSDHIADAAVLPLQVAQYTINVADEPPVGVPASAHYDFLQYQCAANLPALPHPDTYDLNRGKTVFDSKHNFGSSQSKSQQESDDLTLVSTSKTTSAQPVASTKRKAKDEPANDHHLAKKANTSTYQTANALQIQSLTHTHPTSRRQMAPPARAAPKMKPTLRAQPELRPPIKKQKYAKHRQVLDMELPDFSQVRLAYVTQQLAEHDSKERLMALKKYFPDPASDPSIPNTNTERRDAVRIVLGALKDTSHAKDAGTKDFNSRWVDGAGKKYDDADLEATAWDIVTLMERLHREGPSVLSIHDPHYYDRIRASADLTFGERLKVVAVLVMQWKARNDGLIKGSTLQTTVGAPLEALSSANHNFSHNKDRATKLQSAKEHEDDADAPKLSSHKRRHAKTKQNMAQDA